MNPHKVLTNVINRQIANGSPVFVAQDIPLWEVRGKSIKSNSPVTIRVRAESHYAAIKKASRTMMANDCVLVSL